MKIEKDQSLVLTLKVRYDDILSCKDKDELFQKFRKQLEDSFIELRYIDWSK